MPSKQSGEWMARYETRTVDEYLAEPDGDGFQLTRDAEVRLARVHHEMGKAAADVVLFQAKHDAQSGCVIRETDIAKALFRVVLDVLA